MYSYEKIQNEASGPFLWYSVRSRWNLHVCFAYNYCSTTYRLASLYHIKMDTLTQCDILRHFPALSPQEKATREHRKPTILNNLDFRNLEKCSINHRENGTLVGKIRRNITAAFSVAVPHVRSSGGNSRSRSSNIT